ncbi:hypothetical protein ES704_02068 [subsurface metagenome]
MDIGESISGALSSENRRFRYSLWRIWDKSKEALLFIGLNPSTANHIKDDPTIVRLMNFGKSWGFGGLYAGNLFSIVSANPNVLFFESSVEQPNGPNDQAIKQMNKLCSTVLVGWGEWGQNAKLRPAQVISLVGGRVFCLKVNKSGEPSHPLYLPSSSKLILYERGK